ncbi:MAG: spermidine synthase [Candidatus Bathyarchaeia archaeon]
MSYQIRLLLSVVVSGVAVMSLEILGSRLLAPFFGNSVFVWGSLIGVVLAALSGGYYLGGMLADKHPSFDGLSIVIFAAGLVIVALPVLALPIFDSILNLNLDVRYSALLATVMLLGVPSVLLGMVTPYAMRLAAKSLEKIGRASGNLYALSTLGSILGTFLTVFVLIPEFSVSRIILALGVTLLVVALLGLSVRLKVFVLVLLVLISLAAPGMVHNLSLVATSERAVYGVENSSLKTVYEVDTPYHHLLVTDYNDSESGTYIRFLVLDTTVQSAMDLMDPNQTVFPYTDYFHFGVLLNPKIERVLFIGGGGFTGPEKFLRDYPNVNVDVVEIDPQVIWVAEHYFGVDPSNPRLHIYNDDGRLFLRRTNQKYDVVVIDAFSSGYVPFHLMTEEFFREVKNHLTSKGSVILNLVSGISPGSYGVELLQAEDRTLTIVFPNVYLFAVEGPGYQQAQNIIVLATLYPEHLTESDFEQLADKTTIVKVQGLPEDAANLFTLNSTTGLVLTDDFAPVETLINPLTSPPVNYEESVVIMQEVARVAVIALMWVILCMVLRKKRLNQKNVP